MRRQQITAQQPEVDEGSWLYLRFGSQDASSAPLVRQVTELCRDTGWNVYAPAVEDRTGVEAQRDLDAMRLADACVIELCSASDRIASDLAAARAEGRPIVGLRRREETPMPALDDYERAVVVAWSEPDECLRELRRTLVDPQWRTMLREDAPVDDA
jgi:hypothetical protein